MTEKLTPRVGDRVLVAKWWNQERTVIGTVQAHRVASSDVYELSLDGYPVDARYLVLGESLTVVDREQVEWPEGWKLHEWMGKIGPTTFRIGEAAVGREVFERIRGPEGDYVAEHMDELVGGDS